MIKRFFLALSQSVMLISIFASITVVPGEIFIYWGSGWLLIYMFIWMFVGTFYMFWMDLE